MGKHLGKIKDITHSWPGTEKSDICFCANFDGCCQYLVSARETGHSTMHPSKFEILLRFPNFLIY